MSLGFGAVLQGLSMNVVAVTALLLAAREVALPVDTGAIDSLLKKGEALMWDGDRVGALEALEGALSMVLERGDSERQAHAYRLLCGTRGFLGQRQASDEALERALAAARAARSGTEEARAWEMAAHVAWWRGELTLARERCERGLAVACTLESRTSEGGLRLLLGKVHAKAGRLEEARHCARQARELFERADSRAGEAMALHALALFSTEGHEWRTAREHYEEALRLWTEAGDVYRQAEVVSDAGECCVAQGDLPAALAAFDRALEIAGHLSSDAQRASLRARNLHRRAVVLARLGRHGEAVNHLEEALAIRQRQGDREKQAVNLHQLATSLAALDDIERARVAFARALGLLEAVGSRRRVPSILLDRGALLERLEDLAGARADFQRAVDESRGTQQSGVLTAALYQLGRMERRQGHADAALAALGESLGHIESLRPEVSLEDDARAAFVEGHQGVYAETIALLLDLGRGEDALEVAERARARAFLDLLGSQDLPRPLDRSASPGAAHGSPADAPRLSPAAVPHMPVERMREEALSRSTAILEYFVLPDAIAVWVVGVDGQLRWRLLPLGREELGRRIEEFCSGVASRREVFDARPLLRWFDALLLAPIRPSLPRADGSRVTIVPHGPLHRLPFACLLDEDGRYLVERHTLAFVPALGVLEHTRREKRESTEARVPRILIIGDPAMPRVPRRNQPLGRLPGTEREARGLARLFGPEKSTLLLETAASEEAVRSKALQYRWLHFTSHALVDDEDARRSFVALSASAGEDTARDGLLTQEEIFALPLDADLVVLSACNTGRGRITGDGVVGLPRAFLAAGAASVVVSLWAVSDLVAERQMAGFYRALRSSGGAKAASLRTAQLATIDALRRGAIRGPDGRALSENPVLWGPFILVGQPE